MTFLQEPEFLAKNKSSLKSLSPKDLSEEEQARRLLAIAIERQATRFVSHSTVNRIKLTQMQITEGLKGRIVGKEGRNIRYFQERAGVDLLLNEEPDSLMISCFDPFRREVAQAALEILVRDGRIHIGSIEDALKKARSEVECRTKKAGVSAIEELGITQVHPAIVRVLGTLKFRQSFGQNQLEHSIESAWICGSLAAELGFNVALARRAALFHDLGKALDPSHEGAHAASGADFARHYGESAFIVQAIAAHHEEVSPDTWLDHLVIAADALSGGRPGARHGSTQALLDRSTHLEEIAKEVPGVCSAFAVRAGRELRIFVDHQKISDEGVPLLAREVARRIGQEVTFPGQIKVIVHRELRAIEGISQ